MKRTLSIVLAVAALVILTAPAVFAREAELSEIERPVDAASEQYQPNVGGLPAGESVTEERAEDQILVEPLRHENI